MAVTVTPTIVDRLKFIGGKRAVVADLTLSVTYATGGFTLSAANFQLRSLDDLILMDGCDSIGMVWQYTRATKTVVLYWGGALVSTALAEVANTTATTGVMRVIAIGV